MTAPVAPAADVTDEEILGHFESLGDNCEFGLVQRIAGIERLGFFRFNFASLQALVAALDCDFADVDQPGQVEIYTEPNRELMVRIRPYGFQYHTHLREGDVEIEALHAQQVKAVRFLARKLLDDLRSGEKVFVRKGPDSQSTAQIAPLLRALRRHGSATLLWVVPQDERHPLGSVEVIEPGLLKGYIDRFAPYDDAPDLSHVWLDICRGAFRLWRDGSPAGTVIERGERPAASNLIRHADQFGGGAWKPVPRAAAQLSDAVPRQHEACAVTEHRLLETTDVRTGDIYGYAIGHGLSAGGVYVASLSVWLPADFRGELAGAVFNGFESLHVVNARTTLREVWQRVWVAARLPPGVSSAHPSLYVVAPAGTRLFTTRWKLELGAQPTEYEPLAPASAVAPAGRTITPSATDAGAMPGPAPRPADRREAARKALAPAVADGPAGYAGPNVIADFRDIADPEELGTITAPHRLRLGVDMRSRPPPPLFNEAALPHRVAADHATRIIVPGPEFYAVTGHELGSFGLLQQDGRVFAHDRVMPLEAIQRDTMPQHWVRGLLRPDAEIIESDVPVGVVLNAHLVWGHFLLEMLARLHLLAKLRTLGRNLPVALPSDAPAWVREFVAFYFPAEATLTYNSERQRVRAPCFVAPSMMMAQYHLHPALNAVVQELLDRAVGAGPSVPDAPRRLYLSRSRHPGWHTVSNEAEVEATLTDLGFTVLHPQDLPLRAQLAIYAGAECIVAPYSSAAHNALFAPPGTPVFCFGWMNRCQSGIAALRGQPLAYMRPSDCDLIYPPANHQGAFSFRIDCRELVRELPAFLRFAEAERMPPATAAVPPRTAAVARTPPRSSALTPPEWAGAKRPAGVSLADTYGDAVLVRIPSPPMSLAPPEIHNRELIPAELRLAVDRDWSRTTVAGRDVVIRVIGGATVAGDGLVFDDTSTLDPASVAGHLPEQVAKATQAVAACQSDGEIRECSGTYVLCKKNGVDNYGHWLLEMFPKAALALQHLNIPGLRFIVPATDGRLGEVIAACMQSLGIGPDQLLRADAAPVWIERLVVIEGLTQHGIYLSPLAVTAVRRLAEGIPPGPHRHLFITRDDAAPRNFVDPASVVARARASGYEPFDPGTADLWTQIATFAGARRIVGVMGAAMANIVFAPADAEIVMLAPATMPDAFYWFVASLRGQRYVEIRCPVKGGSDGWTRFSWFRDRMLFPEALAETIFPPLAPAARPAPTPAAAPVPSSTATPTPTPTTAAAPPQAAAGGLYRRVWLSHLSDTGAAERLPYLPASELDVPPLTFGETDFSHPGIVEAPPQGPGGARLRHLPVDAYLLHDAVVHGQYGVVTCGGMVVAESTEHLPLHRIAGAEWLGEAQLRLPERPTAATLPAAYHLLTCNLDNYFHWLLEGISRFSAAEVRGLGVLGEVGPDFAPLLPPLDTAWKRESFALLAPPDLRCTVLPDGTNVQVGRLLYIPEFSGGGWRPHRALLAVFDRMRAAGFAALGAQPAVPWRRLFISRADSANRVLVNEAEIAAYATGAGFERVVLDGMSVAQQVRLFAEATHVLAPHGAGLTNLLFCRSGTAVCELHMDCYVQWAFRRLAALRGLRYGCIVGPHIPPRQEWAHHNRYRIDPAQVAAVLADPRFIGD